MFVPKALTANMGTSCPSRCGLIAAMRSYSPLPNEIARTQQRSKRNKSKSEWHANCSSRRNSNFRSFCMNWFLSISSHLQLHLLSSLPARYLICRVCPLVRDWTRKSLSKRDTLCNTRICWLVLVSINEHCDGVSVPKSFNITWY